MTGPRHPIGRLAYGSGSLDIDVPADATVVLPRHRRARRDPLGALRAAISRPVAGPPLRELVRPGQRVAISVCDITRPQPRRCMLAALLEMLDGVIRDEDVVVLIATGTHRASTDAERLRDARRRRARPWRVVDHDARDDDSLVDLGHGRRRAGPAEPRVGRGRPADHDRVRGAALLRRVQRRPEDGGARAGRPGDRARAPQRARGSATRGRRGASSTATRSTTPSARSPRRPASTSRWTSARRREQRITRAFGGEVLAMHAAAAAAAAATRRCSPSSARSTSSSRPTAAIRSTRTSTRRSRACPRRPTVVAAAARSCAPPSAATASRTTGPTARCCIGRLARGAAGADRRVPGHDAGPVAGPDPGAGPGRRRTCSCAPTACPTKRSERPTSSRSRTWARPSWR